MVKKCSGQGTGRTHFFGKRALHFSSVRSEISVEQQDTMQNELRQERHSLVGANADVASTRLLI